MSSNNLFTLGLDVAATKSQINKQLKNIVRELSNEQAVNIVGGLDVAQTTQRMQQQLNDISKNLHFGVQVDASSVKQQTEAIKQEVSSINATGIKVDTSSVGEVKKLPQTFKQTKSAIDATNQSSTGFFGNLKTGVKDALANLIRYQLAYKLIQTTTQAIKAMIKEVCELDRTLTEFNKVADLSTKQLVAFSDRAYEAASSVGRTGRDMIEAATEFKKAGKDIDTSLELGKSALIMTNVAEGITQTSDAAGTLISVLNGFDMDDTDAIKIVDKINSVANQSPIGYDNIADGLERVSGTMKQAGNSIDETIGLLTGGFSQLRNLEKVSTGLVTISMRLRAVDEDGSAIEGLSAELQDAFSKIGIAIEDEKGNLRSTYDILHDYAQIYPELTSKQRQYYAELSAGKRQATVFNAIVDEMATVDAAIDQSIDSVGSATKENETYRNSIEGMKNELKNQFQMLSSEVVESDWIKNLISAATDFLQVLTNIVKQEDLMSGTFGIITNLLKGAASILKEISGNNFVGSLIKGFLTFQTISKGLDIFNFFKGKSSNQNAMNAFFQSAINGTMRVKDGFLQIGEAEKAAFGGKKSISGFGSLNRGL